jgi:hypothetical protein
MQITTIQETMLLVRPQEDAAVMALQGSHQHRPTALPAYSALAAVQHRLQAAQVALAAVAAVAQQAAVAEVAAVAVQQLRAL